MLRVNLRLCLKIRLSWAAAVVVLFLGAANAQPQALIPDDWFTRAPTAERIKSVQAVANSDGWPAVSERLFSGAIRGYELRQENAAVAWYYVARWADFLGQSQSAAGRRWLDLLKKDGGLHPNIPIEDVLSLPDEPIAAKLKPDTITWLLGERVFSESFFSLLSPYDCLPRVAATLQELRAADPVRFGDYAQLGLAIALVYDAEPPPHWPHWQVSKKVLPRQLPPALAAFRFLVDADQRKVTLQRLNSLPAAELKFVVDIVAPFPELIWAQQTVRFPLAEWVKSYESVRYRIDRIEAEQYVWPGDRYDLQEIRREGGICVDQAYFATQSGKARGVPTLLFSGAGRDGRHAWFGYLGLGRKWELDGGRYAEQRYVIGVADDPQTWMPLSDHELGFLSEGFRRLPPYKQSWSHQVFAELYLKMNNPKAAATAARRAVNYERRNLDAWQLLLTASSSEAPRVREGLLTEAAQAMQRYPDLNGRFIRELAASLRARGESSAAEFEERALVRRGRSGGRTDVGVDQAVLLMDQAAPAEATHVYRQVLQQYGPSGGMDFYDRVTRPMVDRLIAGKRKGDALQILTQTRSTLKPEVGSQLDRELKALVETLK
ncbi:MAG: hypothetical protein ABW223_06685 [Rariglobus sp.]